MGVPLLQCTCTDPKQPDTPHIQCAARRTVPAQCSVVRHTSSSVAVRHHNVTAHTVHTFEVRQAVPQVGTRCTAGVIHSKHMDYGFCPAARIPKL